MFKFNKTITARSSLLAAALLAGCGGGDEVTVDLDKPQNLPSEGSSQLSPFQERIKAAEKEGVRKEIFVLAENLGIYTSKLKEDGWNIKEAEIQSIPNSLTTVISINSEEAYSQRPDTVNFLRSFKGVLIIDSSQFGVKQSITRDQVSMSESEQGLQGGGELDQSPNAAADYYYELSNKSASTVPVGSAIITSSVTNSAIAIQVSPDGSVNGASRSDRSLVVNPLIDVMANIEASQSSLSRDFQRSSTPPPIGWDRTADFVVNESGWNLVGRLNVEGYKSGNRHFVAVRVSTGDNHNGCMARGIRCGVYPTAKNHIVLNPNASQSSVPRDVEVTVVGPAHKYHAFAAVSPAMNVTEWAPTEKQWTTENARETDSFERIWSEGFSLTGGITPALAGFFSLPGFSGSYTRATVHRKVTHRWDASETIDQTYTPSGNRKFAQTTITAKQDRIWGELRLDEDFVHPGLPGSEQARQKFRDYVLKAAHCTARGISNWDDTNRHGLSRPRMSYEGWNPSFNVEFEVPASRLQTKDGYVAVVGGVQLQRQVWKFQRRGDVECRGRNGNSPHDAVGLGYRLVHPTTGQLVPKWNYFGMDRVHSFHTSDARTLVRLYARDFVTR